jgi:hypothetical protein
VQAELTVRTIPSSENVPLTRVELFDGALNLLASANGSVEAGHPSITRTNSAGNYFAKVSLVPGATAPDVFKYGFDLQLVGAVPCKDENEPNDDAAHALPIPTGYTRELDVCPNATDQDWFRLEVPWDAVVSFGTYADQVLSDTRVELYDATGTTLLASASSNENEGEGAGMGGLITKTLTAGTYYGVVLGELPIDGSSRYSARYTYETLECPADTFEPDDNFAGATPLLANIPQTHSICPPGGCGLLCGRFHCRRSELRNHYLRRRRELHRGNYR